MKKFTLIICFMLLAASALHAQDSLAVNTYKAVRYGQHVSYHDIRGLYNPHYYVKEPGDPYVPALAGISSYLVPGLGQCIGDEWGRGIFIFLGHSALTVANVVAFSGVFLSAEINDPTLLLICGPAFLIGSAAQLGLGIWNICDAVRIAKVKNMYFQDSASCPDVSFRIEPNLAFVPSGAGYYRPAAGLSLKLSF